MGGRRFAPVVALAAALALPACGPREGYRVFPPQVEDVPTSRAEPAAAARGLPAGPAGEVQRASQRKPTRPPVPRRPAPPRPTIAAIQAQVAARMPDREPSLHRRLARAIHDECARTKLDPLLVLALIQVESSFDPEAVSHAGAVGLMQLLEATMRAELDRMGLPAADPTDPVANVRAGIVYLRRLVDAFGGNVTTALMAYNAGPNRIGAHARAGAIPERFRAYPRRVHVELARVRRAFEAQPTAALAAPGARRPPVG